MFGDFHGTFKTLLRPKVWFPTPFCFGLTIRILEEFCNCIHLQCKNLCFLIVCYFRTSRLRKISSPLGNRGNANFQVQLWLYIKSINHGHRKKAPLGLAKVFISTSRGAQQFFLILFGISSQALKTTNVPHDFVPNPKCYLQLSAPRHLIFMFLFSPLRFSVFTSGDGDSVYFQTHLFSLTTHTP